MPIALRHGFAVLDREFRYVEISPLLAELNGGPRDIHIGASIKELWPDLWEKAGPVLTDVINNGLEFNGEIQALGRRFLASYRPVRGSDYPHLWAHEDQAVYAVMAHVWDADLNSPHGSEGAALFQPNSLVSTVIDLAVLSIYQKHLAGLSNANP